MNKDLKIYLKSIDKKDCKKALWILRNIEKALLTNIQQDNIMIESIMDKIENNISTLIEYQGIDQEDIYLDVLKDQLYELSYYQNEITAILGKKEYFIAPDRLDNSFDKRDIIKFEYNLQKDAEDDEIIKEHIENYNDTYKDDDPITLTNMNEDFYDYLTDSIHWNWWNDDGNIFTEADINQIYVREDLEDNNFMDYPTDYKDFREIAKYVLKEYESTIITLIFDKETEKFYLYANSNSGINIQYLHNSYTKNGYTGE